MNLDELSDSIKDFALKRSAFDLVGIADAVLPDKYKLYHSSWIRQNFMGEMGYLEKNLEMRTDARQVFSEAKSVIVVGLNYFHPEDPMPSESCGKVARFAYGQDYHSLMKQKMSVLSDYIQTLRHPGVSIRSFVDSGSLSERAFALEAGLGFCGKNKTLINKRFGSWFFLGLLVTDLRLRSDSPVIGSCGACRLCLSACPTQALDESENLDCRKCISYWTIEAKSDIPEAIQSKAAPWVFGCDRCQEVCPYNQKNPVTHSEDLYPRRIAGTWLDKSEIDAMTDGVYNARFADSAVKRVKRGRMLKNMRGIPDKK